MTRISDNQELIITTNVPHTDLRGKENRMMDVNIYFASHVSLFQLENAQGKAIFSDDGNNPILYGGRTKNDDTAMNTVWTAITNKTGRLEADETTYKKEPPFGSYQRNRIVVRVDDFTDDESSVLTSSLEDLTDPENPITVKKRKSWVNWENDLGLTVGEITEVKDDTKDPDLRKSEKLRSSIVRVKTI